MAMEVAEPPRKAGPAPSEQDLAATERWLLGLPGAQLPAGKTKPFGLTSGLVLPEPPGAEVEPTPGKKVSVTGRPLKVAGAKIQVLPDELVVGWIALGTGPHPAVAAVTWEGVQFPEENEDEDDGDGSPLQDASLELRLHTWHEASGAYRLTARSDLPPALAERPWDEHGQNPERPPRIFRVADQLLLVVNSTREPCNGPQYACVELDRGYLYALPAKHGVLRRLAELPYGMSTGPEPSGPMGQRVFHFDNDFRDLDGDGRLDVAITPVARNDVFGDGQGSAEMSQRRHRTRAFAGARFIRRGDTLLPVEADLADFVAPYHDRALSLVEKVEHGPAAAALTTAVRAFGAMQLAQAGNEAVLVANDPREPDLGLACLLSLARNTGDLCRTEGIGWRQRSDAGRMDQLLIGLARLIGRIEAAGRKKEAADLKHRLSALRYPDEYDLPDCADVGTGTLRLWHVNGKLWREVTCQAGAEHGPFAVYGDRGKPLEKGELRKGERCGVWKCWDENTGRPRPCRDADEEQRRKDGAVYPACAPETRGGSSP